MTTHPHRSTWTTYRTTGYTHDVAQDQRSAGGVHHHQIRKTSAGWQYRILQSNGLHRAAGPVTPLTEADGSARFASA